MKITTIVLNEKSKTSILKKFFDLSFNIEHTGFNMHSFVFICETVSAVDFGHKYIKKRGFRAIEGYPIERVALTNNNEIKSLNNQIWRKEKEIVWEEMYEDFALQLTDVYSEFEFPKQYEKYSFYKIDIVFYENENRFFKWGFNEEIDEFIGFIQTKNYKRLIASN